SRSARTAAGSWAARWVSAVAAGRHDVTRYAREFVEALAEETGESAFFSARRQSEKICLVRVDGSFPIRSFVLYEVVAVSARGGVRRPGDPGAPTKGRSGAVSAAQRPHRTLGTST
ncbi:MAG: hypothetical protein ABJD68_20130, partial [Nakamurella sp.]